MEGITPRQKRYSGTDNLSSSCWLLGVWCLYILISGCLYTWISGSRMSLVLESSQAEKHPTRLIIVNDCFLATTCVYVREREKFRINWCVWCVCWWRCRRRRILWTVQGRRWESWGQICAADDELGAEYIFILHVGEVEEASADVTSGGRKRSSKGQTSRDKVDELSFLNY